EFAPVQGSETVGRMNHAESFFAAAGQICRDISLGSIEALASELDRVRDRRECLFLIGVAAARRTAATPSTTFASFAASRSIARSTTSRSLPPARTTQDGTRCLRRGSTPV